MSGERDWSFQERVEDRLKQAKELYRDRNAVYKDNFRIVGKVMQALFRRQPTLASEQDFNRWHIFELFIVKLTRYATNWHKGGHEDSIQDMIVYLSILGELDKEWIEIHKNIENPAARNNDRDVPVPIQDRIDTLKEAGKAGTASAEYVGRSLSPQSIRDANYLDRKAPGA